MKSSKTTKNFLDGISKKDLKEILPSGFEKMSKKEQDSVVQNLQREYEKASSKPDKKNSNDFLDGFSKNEIKEIMPAGFEKMTKAEKDDILKKYQEEYEKTPRSPKKTAKPSPQSNNEKEIKKRKKKPEYNKMSWNEINKWDKYLKKKKSPSPSAKKKKPSSPSPKKKKSPSPSPKKKKSPSPSPKKKKPSSSSPKKSKKQEKKDDSSDSDDSISAYDKSELKKLIEEENKKGSISADDKRELKKLIEEENKKDKIVLDFKDLDKSYESERESRSKEKRRESRVKTDDDDDTFEEELKKYYASKDEEEEKIKEEKKKKEEEEKEKELKEKQDRELEELYQDKVLAEYKELINEYWKKFKKNKKEVDPQYGEWIKDLHSIVTSKNDKKILGSITYKYGSEIVDVYVLQEHIKKYGKITEENVGELFIYLTANKLFELYDEYKNKYEESSDPEDASILTKINKKILDKNEGLPEGHKDIKVLLEELEKEHKKKNRGLVIKDEKGKVLRQGDKDFNKAFTKTINNRDNLDLSIKCRTRDGINLPFAYQVIPSVAVAPGGSCDRMLCVHRTGAGKTVTILNVMSNYYHDPRPKICFFPTQELTNNFIAELMEPKYAMNNPYQAYIRSTAKFEEIFMLTTEEPDYFNDIGKKKEKQEVFFKFNTFGVQDLLALSKISSDKKNQSSSFFEQYKEYCEEKKAKGEKSDEKEIKYRGDEAKKQLDLIKVLNKTLGPKNLEEAVNEMYKSMSDYLKSDTKADPPASLLKCLWIYKGGGSGFRLHENPANGGNNYKSTVTTALPKGMDPITAHPKKMVLGKKVSFRQDFETNFKSENMKYNAYNQKIVAIDEVHQAMNPEMIEKISDHQIKNVRYLMELLKDMTGSVLLAMTATPGEREDNIRKLLDYVKGTTNIKKGLNDEGFISYWNYSPRSLYPLLVESEMGDENAEDQVIEMDALHYDYKGDVMPYAYKVKKNGKNLHPFDIPNNDKMNIMNRKDGKLSMFSQASFYYDYATQSKVKNIVDDWKDIHKLDIEKAEKLKEEMNKKNGYMENLMALSNIPIKGTSWQSLRAFKERIKTVKDLKTLRNMSSKMYQVALELIKTKHKTLILMNYSAGIDFLAEILNLFVNKMQQLQDEEKFGKLELPSGPLAECNKETIAENMKNCKKDKPCFIRIITKDDEYLIKTFNSKCNIRGEVIKAVIADAKKYGTGISFYGVRNIYLVNPPQNILEYQQYVGRAMRACASHITYMDERDQLPAEERRLKEEEQKVYVNIFVSIFYGRKLEGTEEGKIVGSNLQDYIGQGPPNKYKIIETIDEINLKKVIREEAEQKKIYKKVLEENAFDTEIYAKLMNKQN